MLTARIPALKSWTAQFRIGESSKAIGELGGHRQLGRWWFDGGQFPKPILDNSGRPIGLMLGTAIDHRQKLLADGPIRFDLPADPTRRDQAIEEFLDRFGGSWLCALVAEGLERIYLDADGTLSLVYDPGQRAAASTTGLLRHSGKSA